MIPTITNISPSRIFTGGQLITITGTGFQTMYPIDPATPHPWPMPAPTVSVTVAGRPAIRVRVWSATKITCLTVSADPGAATVVVRNLDANGAPISGETVSVSNLLTFARVDLTTSSDLTRLIDVLVRELKRQVIENVVFHVSVDFDNDPDALEFAGVDLAKLPAFTLSGPVQQRNRFYGELRPVGQEADGTFSRRSSFETQDLVFNFKVFDKHTARGLNLQALVTQFFRTNNYLSVDRDPSDASKGTVRYELEASEPEDSSVNGTNDLRLFTGTITVRGFQFEDVAGFPTQALAESTDAADDINLSHVVAIR